MDENNTNQNNSAEVQAAVTSALNEQKKKKKKKRLIIFAVLAVVIIVIIAAASSGGKDYDFNNPQETVTVDTILNDFNSDAATASEKYSDKVVAITGKVFNISETAVQLEAYDDNLWLYYVYATMENSEDLKKFTTGETATIVGVCKKTTLFGDIDVDKCVINDSFAITPDYDNAKKVDVGKLISAYKENKVSADETYKNKIIKTTGIVNYVSDDYIVIEPKNADLFDFDCDVAVYFESGDEIKKVKKDKEITIVGECYSDSDIYTVKICRAIIK